MSRRFYCPKGHTWQVEFPDLIGNTTGLMPGCPSCGEFGEPAPDDLPRHSAVRRDPTSRIESAALVIDLESTPTPQPHGPPLLHGYDIVEEIGRGGMGIVYRAIDRRRGGQVAIKCLLRHDPNKLLRFKQEFRAVVDLSHPNLAGVHELVEADGRWCLVMELIDGEPFTDYFRRFDDADVRLARLRVGLRQLIDGLTYLHDAGLLHCDVKPTNVLVTPEGRVVLLDFGLVTEWRPDASESGRQELVGSLGYIAPERFAGKAPTTAVDWYSVGVMLFETFAGRRPFEGTRTNLIWQQRFMDPPMPSEVAAGVPSGFDGLCIGLLERNPALRYGRESLVEFLRDESNGVRQLPPPRTRDSPLVGRDRHLALLQQTLEHARRKQPALVVVRGRTGMGKSALLERFVERIVKRDDTIVLRGRCFEQESVPFKGIDGLIDSLCLYLSDLAEENFRTLLPESMSSLARMFPVLRRLRLGAAHWKAFEPSDPGELRRQAVAALRHLLMALAQQSAVVLCLDDAQWADLDSAWLLAALTRGPDAPPVLLILGLRSEDEASCPLPPELLAAADGAAQRSELVVGPLTELESSSLAQALLSDVAAADDRLADAVAREGRGWPVFIRHLAEHAREQLAQPGGGNGPSPRLEEVIARRFEQLPQRCRQLLQVIALAAQPVRQTTAFLASGIDGEPRSALTLLRTGHWVRTAERDDQQLVECFHDTVRETIVRLLPDEELTASHDRMARALEALQPHEHAWLASHHLGANRTEEAARHYARAGADAEAALAFDRAAQFFRLACDLGSWPADELARLRRRLADALANAGHTAEAAEAFEAVARASDSINGPRLRREAAYFLCASGHIERGVACLGECLRDAGLPTPPTPSRLPLSYMKERLRLWWRGRRFQRRELHQVAPFDRERIDLLWSATAGLTLFDVVGGAYYQLIHLRHALDAGEPLRLARAFAWQAAHASAGGGASIPSAEGWLTEASTLIATSSHAPSQALLALARGIVRFNQGRWFEAKESLTAADDLFRTRCTGVVWERTVVQTFLAWTFFQTGDFAGLRDLAERGSRHARDRGDRLAATNLAVFAVPMARLAADDPIAARAAILEHMAEWPAARVTLQSVSAELNLARIDLYEGNQDQARERLTRLRHERAFRPLLRLGAMRTSVLQLDGLLQVSGDRARARRCARSLKRMATPASQIFARLIRSLLAKSADAWDAAANQFETAGMSAGFGAAARTHGKSARAVDDAVKNPEAMARVFLPAAK